MSTLPQLWTGLGDLLPHSLMLPFWLGGSIDTFNRLAEVTQTLTSGTVLWNMLEDKEESP